MDSVQAGVVDSYDSPVNPTTLQERLAQAMALVAEGYPRSCLSFLLVDATTPKSVRLWQRLSEASVVQTLPPFKLSGAGLQLLKLPCQLRMSRLRCVPVSVHCREGVGHYPLQAPLDLLANNVLRGEAAKVDRRRTFVYCVSHVVAPGFADGLH